MSGTELPTDVEAFLEEHIRSYDQLHVLLLLHKTPDRLWSADAVGLELGMTEDLAEAVLRQLLEERLLIVDVSTIQPRFGLSLASSELQNTLARVAEAYDLQKLAMAQWMTAHAFERVRAGAQNLLAKFFSRRGKPKRP